MKRKANKRFLSLFIVGVLLVMPLSVNADEFGSDMVIEAQDIIVENYTGEDAGIIVPIDEMISPRLSTTTVTKYLNSSWTELYTDANWFDAKATIQNLKGNPGSIDIKIEALDKAGVTVHLYGKSSIGTNLAYISGAISGSSYKSYTVYIKSSISSITGDFKITYFDSAA